MASIDQSLLSNPQEGKWVEEINKILNHQLQINVGTPPISVFQVPENITTKKPEAYEPQHIGLGPIHHFRSQPYKKMEQKKLAVVGKVLQYYEVKDYEVIVLDEVRKLVPIIRLCYDMFLQASDDTLASVFAIDGLFLLILLHTSISQMDRDRQQHLDYLKRIAEASKYEKMIRNEAQTEDEVGLNNKAKRIKKLVDVHPLFKQKEIVVTAKNKTEWERILGFPHHQPKLPEVSPKERLLSQDVMMVENQIPFRVLEEIMGALSAFSGSSSKSSHIFSPFIYRTFCEIRSPLELCSESRAPRYVEHLLDYMYYAIVNNFSRGDSDDTESSSMAEGMPSILQAYTFIKKIPQKEIVQVYEQTISFLETFSQSKILIPSASKIHNRLGFRFKVLEKNQGIKNINIHENHIYLPCVTLNTDSEVILRNLVAYETLIVKSDDFPITEHVALMCALIVNVEDVKLLKTQNVIRGDHFSDVEVAKLFTGMSSSLPTTKTKGKSSNLRKVIDEINKVNESGLRMKIYLVLKKLAYRLLLLLRAIGGFVEASWKIIAFIVSIVTVFFLMWQAYCDSFGCDTTTVTLLPYSSS